MLSPASGCGTAEDYVLDQLGMRVMAIIGRQYRPMWPVSMASIHARIAETMSLA